MSRTWNIRNQYSFDFHLHHINDDITRHYRICYFNPVDYRIQRNDFVNRHNNLDGNWNYEIEFTNINKKYSSKILNRFLQGYSKRQLNKVNTWNTLKSKLCDDILEEIIKFL